MNLLNALALTVPLSLAAAARRTATLTGTHIDVLAYEGAAKVLLNASAAAAGTNPTLNVKLQHSDTETSGDFTDVTGAAFAQVTQVAGTAGLQELLLNIANLKRYLRVIGTIAGTETPTFDFSVEFVGIKKAA